MGKAKTGSASRPVTAIVAGLVIVVLVASGVYWLNGEGAPPIPTVPAEVRAKAEAAVFPVIAEFEKGGGEHVSEYGTCFGAEPVGIFVTCAHVVNPSSSAVTLVGVKLLMDGKEKPAEVVYTSNKSDVAILRVADYGGPPLQLSQQPPAAGSAGFLLGYPTRYAGMAIPKLIGTGAFVEDVEYDYKIGGMDSPVIRLRGTSDFGGSGGPLLDKNGLVLGMAFASRFTDDTKRQTSHVFVIPIRVLRDELERSQKVSVNTMPNPLAPPKAPETNLDGDQFVDSQDSTPYVADYPSVEILVTDFLVGLRPNLTRSVQVSELSVGETEMRQIRRQQRETYEGMETRSTVSSTRYSGGLNASARASVGPHGDVAGISLGYSGSHRQATREQICTQKTETTVTTAKLAKVSSRLKNLTESTTDTLFSPDSGYLKLTVAIRNPSHVDCVLADFAVNVFAGDQLWQTLHAKTQGKFEPKHLAPLQRKSEKSVVVFGGLNMHEVESLLQNEGDLNIAFEILPSSVEIADSIPAGQLSKIVERCTLIEIEYDGGQQQIYVSAMRDGKTPGLSIEELMQRVPRHGTAIEWGNGPFGDSLANFMGKRGLPMLLPHDEPLGRWLVFDNGEELIDSWRSRDVHPGDMLTFRYLTPSDYWGDPMDWVGYVTAYTKLKTLADTENRFWDELYSYNRPNKPTWNVQTQKTIRDQAQALADQYDEFFNSRSLPMAIRRRWPSAKDSVQRFKEWFTGNEPRLPEFVVTVERLNAWWNVNQKLSPWFELKVAGESIVTSGDFAYDEGNRSGSTRFNGKTDKKSPVFTWSPFREVEFQLIDDGTVTNADLVHIRARDLQSLESLLDVQPFDAAAIDNLDPAASQAELMLGITHGDEMIRQDRFRDYFAAILPRPIGVVPAEMSPKLLAFDFWVDHRPVAYAHSAAIFEQLYESRRGQPDELANLARAIAANFRCFDLKHCVELGGKLPPVGNKEDKHVMPGTSLANLRVMLLVAEKLVSEDSNSTAFFAFARVLLHWQSYLRLEHLANESAVRQALGEDLIQDWASRLKSRLANDAGAMPEIGDTTVREFAIGLIENGLAGLEEVSPQPKSKPADNEE